MYNYFLKMPIRTQERNKKTGSILGKTKNVVQPNPNIFIKISNTNKPNVPGDTKHCSNIFHWNFLEIELKHEGEIEKKKTEQNGCSENQPNKRHGKIKILLNNL